MRVADDDFAATSPWPATPLAAELDVERPDRNAIRADCHELLSGVKPLRDSRAG